MKIRNGIPLGRFTCPDPMWEKYYSWTPYQYAACNPVSMMDGNGKWVQIMNSKDRSYPNGFPSLAKDVERPNAYYLARHEFGLQYFQNRLNDKYHSWSDPKSNHFAPKIASYLKENDISIALTRNLNAGGYTDVKAKVTILDMINFKSGSDYTDSESLMHEIVHLQGGNEFQSWSATIAAGLTSIEQYLNDLSIDPEYFLKGMPSSFNKYFDKDHTLIPSMKNQFINDINEYGKKIIGRNQK